MLKYAAFPQQRQAMKAIHAARAMWPGAVSQVIEEEIMSTYDWLSWLGPRSRTVLLINQVLDLYHEDNA